MSQRLLFLSRGRSLAQVDVMRLRKAVLCSPSTCSGVKRFAFSTAFRRRSCSHRPKDLVKRFPFPFPIRFVIPKGSQSLNLIINFISIFIKPGTSQLEFLGKRRVEWRMSGLLVSRHSSTGESCPARDWVRGVQSVSIIRVDALNDAEIVKNDQNTCN